MTSLEMLASHTHTPQTHAHTCTHTHTYAHTLSETKRMYCCTLKFIDIMRSLSLDFLFQINIAFQRSEKFIQALSPPPPPHFRIYPVLPLWSSRSVSLNDEYFSRPVKVDCLSLPFFTLLSSRRSIMWCCTWFCSLRWCLEFLNTLELTDDASH